MVILSFGLADVWSLRSWVWKLSNEIAEYTAKFLLLSLLS